MIQFAFLLISFRQEGKIFAELGECARTCPLNSQHASREILDRFVKDVNATAGK